MIPPLKWIVKKDLYDFIPNLRKLGTEIFEESEVYALTEICIGYESYLYSDVSSVDPDKIEELKFFSMNISRDDTGHVTVPLLPGNVKLEKLQKNDVLKLTIALTQSTFAFFNNEKFDIEVIIRCIKNTTLKDMNIDEINKYEFFANDIENFARGNSEMREVAFEKFFLELPNKSEPNVLRTKISDFSILIEKLCDPKTGSYKNVPPGKRYNQRLDTFTLSRQVWTIKKPQQERSKVQSKKYRNCEIIDFHSVNLSDLNLDEFYTNKLRDLTLVDINLMNNLSALRKCIKNIKIHNLTRLQLNSCNITDLSEIIFKNLPTNLEEINFEKNDIKAIPKSISRLTKLGKLILDENENLCDIPWDHLPTSLKLLSLKFTAVITVSSDIKRLKNLYYFTVFSKYLNHISWEDITAEIESLWVKTESNLNIIKLNDKEKLNFLAVESPKLVEFNGLDAPVSLTLLTLDNCELQKFDLMNNFQNLKKLSLNNNEISEIQWETLPLSLEKISFSNNKLKFIGNISHLQQLKEFNARSNEIECISESITTLQNLKDFILSSNKLSSLPNGFENLQNLGVFVLASNKFEMIYIKIYGSDYHHIYIA